MNVNVLLIKKAANVVGKLLFALFFIGSQTCQVNPNKRWPCGWWNIEKNNCEAKGCCFDYNAKGIKRCFYSETGMT